MRRTIFRNGTKVEERLYEKVDDRNEILRIEELSSEWKTFDAERQHGYVIRGQKNADGMLNGYFKIVDCSKIKIRRNGWNEITAIDSNIGDWIYYKRRRSR